jgi:hypothetical protein
MWEMTIESSKQANEQRANVVIDMDKEGETGMEGRGREYMYREAKRQRPACANERRGQSSYLSRSQWEEAVQ